MIQRTRTTRLARVAVPLLVFVVATFVFLARPLLGERTYTAVDLLERTAPYRDAIERPPEIVSVIQGDQVEQYGPAAIMSRDTLERGEWQTWDPHIAAGTPAGIPPLIANLAPPQWAYLVFPGWYAAGAAAAIAIFMSQWFFYLFVRRLGAAMLPAIIGAIAYTYTGTNLAFVNRIWAVFVLPAMLWAVHRLLQRRGVANALLLGVFVAWAWYEGFPSGWVYCVATAGGLAVALLLSRWWAERRSHTGTVDGLPVARWLGVNVGWLALGFGWGGALSALTLVPLTHEVSAREILAMRTFDSSSHLEGVNVFSVLTSRVPGPPTRGPWWTGLNPFEGSTYLGLTVVAIVALGLGLAFLKRIHTSDDAASAWVFFSALGTLALVLSFVGTPLLDVAYKVPGFANNPIWRMRFVIGLAAAVLLSLTLDSLWRAGLRTARAHRGLIGWSSVAVLAVIGAVFVRFTPRLVDTARAQGAVDLLRSDVLRNAAVALGVVVLVLAAVRWPRFVIVAAVVTGTAIYMQLVIPSYDLTPAAPISDFFTEQRGHRELAQLTDGRFRYAASGPNFYWNTSEVFGLYDLRGAALHAPEFRQLMHEVSDLSFTRDPFKIQLVRDEWDLSSPVLDDLGVGYFALGTDEQPYGEPDRTLDAPGAWVPVGAPLTMSGDLGRIDGVEIPLRATGSCDDGTLRVRLERNGTTTSTSRPLHDVNGSVLAFAAMSPGEAPGLVNLDVSSNNPRCRVEIGVTGPGGEVAGSFLQIAEDAPVRLASTEQAWIYRRPSAQPMITSYGQWREFDDQEEALAWLRTRPAAEADTVPVVGSVPASSPDGAPARIVSQHIANESVSVRSEGATPALVSIGQVIGDGWEATVDGRSAPIVLVDGGIMAVHVAAGTHDVEFHYRPTSVAIGKLVSAVAVVFGVGALVWLAIRRRRSRGGAPVSADDAAVEASPASPPRS